MAHPKRRHSRARGKRRRTNWTIETPNVVGCKNCGAKKLQHFICPSCGFYRGEEVMAVSHS